ncbi:M14 family metallopeptidase [Sulfurospirillum arcachonense]|uniref:M14 family metallopeptidase n=1 Tax=Sulfurospirillum arcachonense TaxID=57666 RepID=UPI00046A558A|nr:M14 family zinc carboxypeptidase [Sulfurospirillum arcachonense]
MKKLYKSYNESTNIFQEYEKTYPKHFKIESIGQTWEKREINVITISKDIKSADTKPALFFTGTIHAREWIGHELAVEFTKYILENLEQDLMLQLYLEKATIYMVPCANPDGYEYSRSHFNFWRKNRRENADGSFGVDLNRNFPIGFVSGTKPNSNVYGGPTPFSEPETIALRDFVESHSNITIALDYHSQGNVFFPAHDFRHEDAIDTTDINILCANMAEKIRKVSYREYGIHQGKPPAKLISGSGREFYHSKGILSSVVEVGTRNISDYMGNMNEHLREHIEALLSALNDVPNYGEKAKLKRVDSFEINSVGSSSVSLKWTYNSKKDVYFELYRSRKDKSFCMGSNLVTRTKSLEFTDLHLESCTDYYYNIRAVNKSRTIKSAFYPQIRVRTDTDFDEFTRTYHAQASKTGYVAEKLKNNAQHFGVNSLFVGVDQLKGVSYAIVTINPLRIPKNITIKSAYFSLYPINRVSATIEKYGEWNVGLVDPQSIKDITNFDEVDNMKIISYVGKPTKSHQLTQGIWRKWDFSGLECDALNEQIQNGLITFRIEGPKELEAGRSKQMMQWDLGYGKFSGGLEYRPRLELTYKLEPEITTIYPKIIHTISKNKIQENELISGFDKDGSKIYSTMEFNLGTIPPYNETMIVNAYLELNSTKIYLKDDIRFHLEFVDESIDKDFEGISNREVIQNIGYDVSANELKNNQTQYFMFDEFSNRELNQKLKDRSDVAFVLKPTSSKKSIKDKIVAWEVNNKDLSPKLIIEHIAKRRFPVAQVKNAKVFIENGKIKLTWENPTENGFRGTKVIKNPYRFPASQKDGQKIYAGPDNYTYDDFGALDISKYFSIFTYDDVPNYSEPVVIQYIPENK